MDYKILINDFEGPLDLLLHLIKQSDISIFDISIEQITKQYLDYITKMEELNLNIASEYLVMAAELIEMKSLVLLPNSKSESDDEYEEDPKEIVNKAVEKGISSENFQVLAPMYKGINGIDSLNSMMAEIFNPNAEKFIIGDKYYRINDKVIQLVNDVDNNVYNGDIGYIKDIYYIDKKLIVEIDYSGNIVEYKNGEFDKFNLAYAVSIHKSQGSEYANVVIILASSFNRMFYNKLIYTAVTRAKSSLIILGSIDSLNKSVLTNYGANRNTYLKYV